jgi:hypothetical protein
MKTLSAIKYLLVFFLLAGMGCEEAILDQEFTIGKEESFQVNQLYTSDDGQYTLKIIDVSDSRCPKGVYCFWGGEITIKGEMAGNGSKSSFEIHSVVSKANKQPEEFTIQIVDAKPHPNQVTESKPEDVVVTLLIQKK